MADKDIDQISGVETTGHEWDGIKELNNPLPRWWINTFYITIVFSIGYCILYPALPGLHSNTKGWWNWSSRHDVAAEMSAVEAGRNGIQEKIAASDIKSILADPEMKVFAVAAGASAFKAHCTQCHGSGAQGAVGYPNLNDDEWLWGGSPDQIVATISHGVRSSLDAETHNSQMPAFGKDEILKSDQISDVANYVLQLAKLDHDADKAQRGQLVFKDNCAACHGDSGEGKVEFGAPRLADQIWLYKGTVEGIIAQVNNPRHGVMPAWLPQLGNAKVKELAAYVISLGGAK